MNTLRNKLGLTQEEFAKQMQTFFPRCSATAVSLAERSDESGVTFTAEFVQTAHSEFKTLKTAYARKHSEHITFWTDERQKEWLEAQGNVGQYIRGLIDADMQKAASRGGDSASGTGENATHIVHDF